MNFGDIKTKWEYMDFIKQAREEKPYRGVEMPKYPLGNRRYSDRYWVPRIGLEDKDNWMSKSPPIEIYYGNSPLGVFYPDNTFEFAHRHYCGGDTMIMSRLLPGWIAYKIQYGGLIFHHKQTRVTHPVYKAMRIRLCDGAPTKDYEIHINVVDRKATAPLRKEYDEFFKTAGVMLRAMGDDAIYRELQEMHKDSKSHSQRELNMQDPAGTIMNLVLKYNWADTATRLHYSNNEWSFRIFSSHSRGGENLVKSIKEILFKELYIQGIEEGKQYLKTKIYKPGDKLATCYWGHKIIVDGAEVERIK